MSRLTTLGSVALLLGLFGACDGGSTLTPVETDTDTDTDADADGDLIGILVAPEKVVIPQGDSIQLKATGLRGDRSSSDMTHVATWGSSDASVAEVSDGLDNEGLITGVSTGTAKVWAEVGGVRSPEVKIEVTDAQLLGLTVEPKDITVEMGGSTQLTATAAFSDGNRSDASAQVQWVTSDGHIARLESGGLLKGTNPGSTTIRAEWEGTKSEDIPVTVVGSAEPDLKIKEIEGEVAADSITLTITVENEGNVGVSEAWVDVYVDPASTPVAGDFGTYYGNIPYVDANGEAEIGFQFDVSEGAHDFYVQVDADNSVAESDESNNGLGAAFTISAAAPAGPNLTVAYFDVITDPISLYYAIDIYNAGGEDVGDFWVDVYLDQPSEPTTPSNGDEYKKVTGLAAGGTEQVDFLLDTTCAACKSWILIDSLNEIVETDETDNVAGPLTVTSE